nr:MAG TPA: hypothetical protein [Caudoviricetes sp.]
MPREGGDHAMVLGCHYRQGAEWLALETAPPLVR